MPGLARLCPGIRMTIRTGTILGLTKTFRASISWLKSMAQVYGGTPFNGVRVAPGTHKLGKIDITAIVEASGSERLKDAVQIICEARLYCDL